jgi:hypothetical protein
MTGKMAEGVYVMRASMNMCFGRMFDGYMRVENPPRPLAYQLNGWSG